jgi:hypothetical protein
LAVGGAGTELASVVPAATDEYPGIALGDHVLAWRDPYHIAGRLMVRDVLENGSLINTGDLGGFSSTYQVYGLPGQINATTGTFEVGGHILSSGWFYVTHAFFVP